MQRVVLLGQDKVKKLRGASESNKINDLAGLLGIGLYLSSKADPLICIQKWSSTYISVIVSKSIWSSLAVCSKDVPFLMRQNRIIWHMK